jgi:gamma-glutamyl:cysteine ligase YbdK (ATP-grasp superfamily)
VSGENPYGLWEVVGVEIEYMIVDGATLDVRPIADLLIAAASGEEGAADVDRGPIAWSNELALHVLEFKTNGPAPGFGGLVGPFQRSIDEANHHLAALGARLLPGGMHPWMDPAREHRLWPHEYNEVYRAFDRIFGTSGHGWSNLQSTHINLPFRGEDEFFRLHEAIRLVLPLIPALTASSPVLDGARGAALDNRLLAYRGNARRVPSVTGRVVPERVADTHAYRRDVLGAIYHDMAELDPEGVLRHEWVNARGATLRMERGAIEIRVIDAQECAVADVGVAAAVTHAVRFLAEGPLAHHAPEIDQDTLVDVLEGTIWQGERAYVESLEYRAVLGMESAEAPTTGDVWRHLVEVGAATDPAAEEWGAALDTILEEGPLARRILACLPVGGSAGDERERLRVVYGRLADCLARGEVFHAEEV